MDEDVKMIDILIDAIKELGIHESRIKRETDYYDGMSKKIFIHVDLGLDGIKSIESTKGQKFDDLNEKKLSCSYHPDEKMVIIPNNFHREPWKVIRLEDPEGMERFTRAFIEAARHCVGYETELALYRAMTSLEQFKSILHLQYK